MPFLQIVIDCGRVGCIKEDGSCHFLRPRSNENGPRCTLRQVGGEREELAESGGVPLRSGYCLAMERTANKKAMENLMLIRNLQARLRKAEDRCADLERETTPFELG